MPITISSVLFMQSPEFVFITRTKVYLMYENTRPPIQSHNEQPWEGHKLNFQPILHDFHCNFFFLFPIFPLVSRNAITFHAGRFTRRA